MNNTCFINANIDDSSTPDYLIHWYNPASVSSGSYKVFTYGQGKLLAIAVFNTLYPKLNISRIKKI